MGDIRITGNNQTPYAPHVGLQSIPTKTGPSSGSPSQIPADNGPLLGTESTSEVPPEGDVPNPTEGDSTTSSGGTPVSGNMPPPIPTSEPKDKNDPWYLYKRAGWLENQLASQEKYQEQAESLQTIIEDDPTSPRAKDAQTLLTKLRQLMWSDSEFNDRENEFGDVSQYGPNGELTEGVLNKDNPSLAGDGMTNEAKIANGLNLFDQDSDHDGITDYGELWLKQHNYDYAGMDPHNPDSNHNGILDGLELPASVRVDNNGRPIVVGGNNQPGAGTSSTGGAAGPTNYQWNPPSSSAQSVNAADGDKTVSGQYDTVINGDGGPLDFSKNGKDLVVKTDKGTITITGYYDDSGKAVGKVFVEGKAGSITTSNGSNVFGTVDSNGDGYADAGIHFASGIDTSGVVNNYDPFNGNGPAVNASESTKDTTVYDSGGSGQFTIPSEINGQEVKAVDVSVDNNGDVIIKCEGAINGDPLKTFKIKGGKSALESGAIHFKLADNGQYFYCPNVDCTVDGGKGGDEITVKGGKVTGGAGNDMIRSIDDALDADGGIGDDYVIGGSAVDNLKGGEGDGMDFLYSGTSSGDTMDGGDGDDILIVGDPHVGAVYNLKGGGGNNMTNSANPSVGSLANGFQITGNDPGGIMNFITSHEKDANANLLDELKKLHDPATGQGILDGAAEDVSSTVAQAAAAFLVEKKKEFDANYGGKHDTGFNQNGGSTPPATPPATPPVSGQSVNTPGVMAQSFSSHESSRRRDRGDNSDFTDDGDIPSPMFD